MAEKLPPKLYLVRTPGYGSDSDFATAHNLEGIKEGDIVAEYVLNNVRRVEKIALKFTDIDFEEST